MQDRLVLDGGQVLQVDQDKLFEQINIQLGVYLITFRIDPAHFSYDDSDYGNEGLPLLFDHSCPIDEWKQFRWIYTDTGSATDKNTKHSHRIGVKFVYADWPVTHPFTGPFTGFAWLVIQPKDGQYSLSLERVVLALDSRSRPDIQKSRELRDLIRLSQLLQQLAEGIQEKLFPLNGRHNTKDNILFSFALPELSFAKLEEGAEFDTLSPLDVPGRLAKLKQEGVQVSEIPRQRETARVSLRNNPTVSRATPEPEPEPEPVRLIQVAQLSPISLQLLSDQLRSLY